MSEVRPKRERKQPTRINREIPPAVHAMLVEMANVVHGGNTGPVLCSAIRHEYEIYLKEHAERAAAFLAWADAEERAKNGG